MIKQILIVGILGILAFSVYSYKLGEVPNGIYVDEAVTGINSYSILMTGKDENGKSFPVLFRFFGSYSPPLYVYLTTIPIYLTELSAKSIRFVSVICGVLMLTVLYGFLKQSELFNKKTILICLLLFLITPWNYFYARIGYEIYLGFFIYSLGCLLLWLGLKNKTFLVLGLGFSSLSIYGSHAQFFTVPLLLILFLVIFYGKIDKKYFIYGVIIAFVIQIPRLLLINTQAFLNKGDLFYSDAILNNAEKIHIPEFISIPLSFSFSFFSQFTYYFSPKSLFLTGDPDPQRSIPELSVFYSWMLIPYLTGLYILFSNLKRDFVRYLLILIFVSALPASLTHDPFSSQRSLPILLPLFLIICFGISKIYDRLKVRKFNITAIFLILASLFLLWRSYFVLLPSERAAIWNYEYKQLAEEIKKRPEVNFVIEDSKGKPAYSELAFYLRTNPEILQQSVDSNIKEDYYNQGDFDKGINFENMKFRSIVWEEDVYKKQILVASGLAISENQQKEHFLEEVFKIQDSRGYKIISGFITNPERKCFETKNASENCPQQIE